MITAPGFGFVAFVFDVLDEVLRVAMMDARTHRTNSKTNQWSRCIGFRREYLVAGFRHEHRMFELRR
jgi:hypothetical protein